MTTRQELADKWRSDLLKVQGDELTIELGRRGASELLELLNLTDPDPAKDIVKATHPPRRPRAGSIRTTRRDTSNSTSGNRHPKLLARLHLCGDASDTLCAYATPDNHNSGVAFRVLAAHRAGPSDNGAPF